MRKWMRDRMKRRKKPGNTTGDATGSQEQTPAPLQPTFLDREDTAPSAGDTAPSSNLQPEYEAQPETEPGEEPAVAPEAAAVTAQQSQGERQRRDRSRRRGRRGRGARNKQQPGQPAVVPIAPGLATGEAAEAELDGTEQPAATAEPKPQAKKKGKSKGAVVLAIGLPGSGKSSWFKRHSIIPLSSDLVRGLLFDDPTEQRFQDLVFSTLRAMLRARMIAGRPWNYIDATNLSPKERHSWIKMAKDFGYEAHAVFFDVPTAVCMERNRMRSRNVPDEIMLRMAQKLRPPKFEEGFSKVTIVRLKRSASAPESQPEEPIEDSE
jgi:predicted kinase